MRKLAFGALAMVGLLLGACGDDGGGSGDDGPDLIDAAPDVDAPEGCNPVEQTGCADGEKCTWVTINRAQQLGVTECVPAGDKLEGEACTQGPEGETTGFDDCAAGLYCISGVCETICTNSPDSCNPEAYACATYRGVFGAMPTFGVCDFKCSPGTQRRLAGDADACGSPDPAAPTRGCYGIFQDYTCSPVVSDRTHGQCGNQAEVPVSECDPFLNACAPGYGLFQIVEGTEAELLCVAYCQPQEVHSGTANAELAKRGTSPNSLNAPDRVGVPAQFECKYLWWLQAIFGEDAFISEELNDSGVAFDPQGWTYDDDMNAGTPDVPFESCVDVPNTDEDKSGAPDHEEWGCAPLAPAANGKDRAKNIRANGAFRPVVLERVAN